MHVQSAKFFQENILTFLFNILFYLLWLSLDWNKTAAIDFFYIYTIYNEQQRNAVSLYGMLTLEYTGTVYAI
jgi:hypothetical protein